MVKDRRRLKKPAGYRFHIPLIFFAAAFLVFGLVKNQSGKSDMPPGGTVLSSLFDAAQTELNVSSGLPQLEKGSKKAEAPAEEPGSGADIPESLTDSGELKLILNRRPIAGITINPSEPDSASKIAIKNETSYSPDINALVKLGPSLKLSGVGPQVLIFHTHTTESYTPTGEDSYAADENNRTLDNRYNVVRVGDEIEKVLKRNGINVVHITGSYFDYPSYTGSYTRSLEAVTRQLKKYPSIKVVLDIHRDAMITSKGVKYKTVSKINGKSAAQIMFVCGTDKGGLSHPDWRRNLAFDVTLQKALLDKYPDIMRPINLRQARFNQHVSPCAALVEIGTSGNTLDEAVYSASLFADTLSGILKKYRK